MTAAESALPPVAVSIEKAAAMAGVSRSHAYAEIGAGRLRACRIGARTVVKIVDLHRWLDAGATIPA